MQKFIVIGSALIFTIGLLGKNNEVAGFAAFVFIAFFAIKFVWSGTKWGARTTKNALVSTMENAKQERQYNKEQARDRKEWEEKLRRELEREEKLSKVRNLKWTRNLGQVFKWDTV